MREGATYDLMYVNPQLAQQQFAFIRKAATDVLLIVANFADTEVEADINIPAHAFQFLQLPQREFTATDLLSGAMVKGTLFENEPVHLQVPPLSGCVLKLKL